MKKALLVVCLFSLSAPGFAQQGQTGLNGLQFVAPLRLSTGTDHHFLVDRTDPNERLFVLSLPPSVQPAAPDIRPKELNDQFLLLTLPRIAFQNDSKRHEFTATYVPEFELFQHNSDQNALNQAAAATFTYFFTRNLSVAIGDAYRTSHDPARTLDNVLLLLPRSKYTENDIRGMVEFQPNARTAFAAKYDNGYTNFGQTDPFQARILDSSATGYSFSATRMLRPNHRLRATYSIFTIKPINQQSRNNDAVDTKAPAPINSVSLEYRWSANPNTILALSGGGIRLSTGLNYTFQAYIDRRIGTFWLGGGYSRSLSFGSGPTTGFSLGLGANSFYDIVSFTFKGQPTRRTALFLSTMMSRAVSNPIIEANKSLMGRARFDYRVSDRNVLFTSIETFEQNDNAYVRAPLSRNRFSVGIEISLSSETQRRLNHLNEDAQNVALTDHARRRPTPDQ